MKIKRALKNTLTTIPMLGIVAVIVVSTISHLVSAIGGAR